MIFSFVGSPLSGKSTFGKDISTILGFDYFSTGEYARSLGMNPKEESIKDNDLSFDFNQIINKEVLHKIGTSRDLILDGFPRSEEQVVLLNELDIEYYIIYFYADPALILSRMNNKDRGRESDIREYVMGRINSSVKLRSDLNRKCDNFMVYTVTDNFIEDRNSILKYIKEIAYASKIIR